MQNPSKNTNKKHPATIPKNEWKINMYVYSFTKNLTKNCKLPIFTAFVITKPSSFLSLAKVEVIKAKNKSSLKYILQSTKRYCLKILFISVPTDSKSTTS